MSLIIKEKTSDWICLYPCLPSPSDWWKFWIMKKTITEWTMQLAGFMISELNRNFIDNKKLLKFRLLLIVFELLKQLFSPFRVLIWGFEESWWQLDGLLSLLYLWKGGTENIGYFRFLWDDNKEGKFLFLNQIYQSMIRSERLYIFSIIHLIFRWKSKGSRMYERNPFTHFYY